MQSHEDVAVSVLEWWSANAKQSARIARDAARLTARIRYANSVDEVLGIGPAAEVARGVECDEKLLGAAIGALSWARESCLEDCLINGLGRRLASEPGSARMPESMFHGILQAGSADELMAEIRNATRLRGRRVPVRSTALDVLNWGAAVKRKWIGAYYGEFKELV